MSKISRFVLQFALFIGVALLGVFAPAKAFGATSITVIVGAAGTGTQDANFIADGQILFADPDIGGNTLSTGALVSVCCDIVVQATSTITFNDLGGTLTLMTPGGNSVTFSTATGGGGAITFTNTTNTLATSGGNIILSAGTSLTPAKLDSAGGDITLTADNQNIQQPVNAGNGVVTLQPFNDPQIIDLGGADAAGTLGLTDTELGQVTGSILRIGNTNNFGGITISSAITRHAGFTVLALRHGFSISQAAPLSVANLEAFTTTGDVTLTNAGNDVDTLAGGAQGGGNFHYTDTNGLIIGAVDLETGINANNDLTITTGGTLAINEQLQTPNTFIQLNAGGAVTESASGQLVAPNLQLLGAGPYFLNNPANDVGTVAANVTNNVGYTDANDLVIGTVNGTVGVASAAHSVNVQTVAGDLTVNNNVAAGTVANLISGSTIGSPDHILTNNAAITGASATLAGDRMALDSGTINVGAGIADLTVSSVLRPLNLDNTAGDPNGEMRLSQKELNTVTAGILRVGDLNSAGLLTIKSAITNPAGWTTLSLLTAINGAISQNAGAALTVANLNASGYSGVTLNQNNVVAKLSGACAVGAFVFNNSTSFAVDSVDPGTGGGFGQGIISDAQAVNLTVNLANGTLSVNRLINTTVSFGFPASGGALVNLTADNVALVSIPSINAGTSSTAFFHPFTLNRPITLGTKPGTTLGLLQSDLNQVMAGTVQVGDAVTNTGGITITAAISAPATWNKLDLRQNAGFNQTGAGSLTVANLLFTDGTSAAHTWTISSASVTQSPNAAIPISGVTNLTVTGGSGSDTFNTTPGASTTMTVNGGNPTPPASPGDALNIIAGGASNLLLTKTSTPSGFQGQYTFGNRQPVNFTQMETLNPSCATPPIITCPGGITKFSDPGQNSATINPGSPVVTGGCAPVTLQGVRSDGKPLSAPYPIGTTVITWTARGAGNFSTSCSQTITVMAPSSDRRHP